MSQMNAMNEARELTTPLADLRHIFLAGPRNAGKSSFLNLLLEREVSIVSSVPGTTTDPVTRKMELGPLGPVAITDTAGVDDEGPLGLLRVEKTMDRLGASDLVIFLTPRSQGLLPQEQALETFLKEKNVPVLYVGTHGDQPQDAAKALWLQERSALPFNGLTGEGLEAVKQKLFENAGTVEAERTPLEGLVGEGDLVLLVTPIDLAAPQGRLILPQVKTIRDALDKDCGVLVVKERELGRFYGMLKERPKLVVCDSQAFSSVAADLPEDQPLTSFSILFARIKGDLDQFLAGLKALERLGKRDRVMILESCAHHRQADDIATVKIPRLLHQLISPELEIVTLRGMPNWTELEKVSLIIHCGSCSLTQARMGQRLETFKESAVPVTNFGIFLAWAHGLFPRALIPLGY